jgi:tRNA threonylcarbamoyladenosine biosynthesis protein TsaB
MIVLGIETSTMTEGVAVVDGQRVLAEHRTDVGSTHAEQLMPVILQTLRSANLVFDDINGIAVSIGPGSFTGLRIGLSTAKGLCLARHLSMAAVPTLDGLAYLLPFCQYQICPILDAKRKEVYTAFYNTTEGVPKRRTDYRSIRPEHLLDDISEPTVFLGDGAGVYEELIKERLGSQALFAPFHLTVPNGSAIAFLGHQLLSEGKEADIRNIEPLYLRKSDAEIQRKLSQSP